jgi:hypothetical protein
LLNKLLAFDVPAKKDLMMEKPAAQTLFDLCYPLILKEDLLLWKERALKLVKVMQPQ